MGKWNHRWRPRNRYRQEDSYLKHDPQTLSADDWKSNVPSWERQFCFLIGSVPWNKIMVTKKYMDCHDSVVNWKDSATEEAFINAKKRFRADMDGLHCDIPLPDPNMYIEEIDWNPEIDPKLIADLDTAYFNPEESEKNEELETVEHTPYNPWKGSGSKATEAASNDMAQGWNDWDDLVGGESSKKRYNVTENPWVKGGVVNDNNNNNNSSWGWKQKEQVHDERQWSNNFNNNCNWQNAESSKGTGWCSYSNNYTGQNQINSAQDWGWRQQPGQNNDRKYLNFGISGTGQWRKREGPHNYSSSRHKSPRFNGDDCISDHHWKNENNQKRVGFS